MAGNITLSFTPYIDDYQEFIDRLRASLTNSRSHNIPVLPPQTDPVSWVDVRLVNNNNGDAITVRIDRRNVYVRGYSTDNGATFWEFADSENIPGSRRLAYTGSYTNGYNFVSASGASRDTIRLGGQNMLGAISTLFRTPDPNTSERDALKNCAKALLCLVQMIAESARFNQITQHIVTNWYTSQPLPLQLVGLEQSFGSFSSLVQRTEDPADDNTQLPGVMNPNPEGIVTLGEARTALALLLYFSPTSGRRNILLQLLTDDSPTATGPSYYRTLVSIDYVLLVGIDGENPGDLHGTVKIKNWMGEFTAYDRGSHNSEKKGPDQYATLTGPSIPICGDDVFVISINLWDYDTFSPNDQIALGDIVWEPRTENQTFENYDRQLEKTVNGQYGSVRVGYSVMRYALSATISVVLINGDGESPADVYGTIRVSRQLGGGAPPVTLFDKAQHSSVEVRPNQNIPLDRSVVVMPLSGMTVSAILWDYDVISHDDRIANGDANFDAVVGTQTKSIFGKYGEVRVSVTLL